MHYELKFTVDGVRPDRLETRTRLAARELDVPLSVQSATVHRVPGNNPDMATVLVDFHDPAAIRDQLYEIAGRLAVRYGYPLSHPAQLDSGRTISVKHEQALIDDHVADRDPAFELGGDTADETTQFNLTLGDDE